jgi:hypothetical protein
MLSLVFLAALAAQAAALALQRPQADCLNPPITSLTTFSFFPSDYQIRSIKPVATSQDRLSTTVSCNAVSRCADPHGSRGSASTGAAI